MKFFKNILLSLLKKYKRRFPKVLSIEFSSACNAKCIMCPQPEMDRKKENMSMETLEKILDDCVGQPLKKINLFWMGDSTVDKHMIEKFRLVRKRLPNVKLYLSTNSQLLGEDRSRKIIDEKLLDVINFDIDGFTRKTFESVRVRLDFKKVVDNVMFFINYNKQKQAKIETRVTIIDMQPTKHEVKKFVEHWTPLVDDVNVNHYNTWLGTQEERNYDSDEHFKQEHSNRYTESTTEGFNFSCLHPWEEMVIGADGRVGLCCLDYELSAEIGDIQGNTLKEIWQGDKVDMYRKKHDELKYHEIEACKDCNAHTFQKDKLWAKLH
jgi:radical SAM protein with 4Fe4S-binding SPASM domain